MARREPDKLIYEAVDAVQVEKDPQVRAQLATNALNALRAASEELRDLRQSACVELYRDNWSYQQIGDLLGVGKARASQLVSGHKAPKRPGVIEMETKIALAELRASGAGDKEVVDVLLPKIRSYRGAGRLELEDLADLMEVDAGWLRSYLPRVPQG